MKLEKEFVTIGGGIGSFCFYNALRIHGVPVEDIAIISLHKSPYHQFKIYSDNIGLEKLRSDSGSRPDNFWGFPGYGLVEALNLLKERKLFSASRILLQLFIEPLMLGYYCPEASAVYKAIDRESTRTRWNEALRLGEAISLKKFDDGKYEVIYKDLKGKKIKIHTKHVHLSLGHGSSSYKNHEKLFKKLKRQGGRVLVKGRGTAAARTIERLLEIESKKRIEVVSLHRNELPDYGDNRSLKQRQFLNWRLQQFNWPRSAFGGSLLEKIAENTSLKYLFQWGLPSAVPDRKWIQLIRKSFNEKRYKIVFSEQQAGADYIIDCTGFNENPKQNKFYTKLIKNYDLSTNAMGNITTGKHFEIEKLCSYNGRVSLTGIAAAGNYYGPVDSFLGHQYAAIQIINNNTGVKPLNPITSLLEWAKWIKNTKI